MNDSLSPRASAKHIARESKCVTVHEQGIKALARAVLKGLQQNTLNILAYSRTEIHPQKADESAIDWIFVVDTLNFCFWSPTDKKWTVTWKGKTYSGYFALCAAVNRAIEEGYPLTDALYYSKVTLDDLKWIFRGDEDSTEIPLIKERLKCLHEAGQILLDKYGGSFVTCLKACDSSAEKLLQIVTENFDCFRDEGVFDSVRVSFHKKAQILIADIWVCFKGKDHGYFKDIGKLTMFADYRIPQVLVHFNAIQYAEPLMNLLVKDEIIIHGSREEMEIRGCTIHVVDLILEEVKSMEPSIREELDEGDTCSELICNAVLIDYFLWDYRRKHAEELNHIPYHKSFSIFY